MIVGQGPIALAVGAGGVCWDIFTLPYHFSPLSPSLWETVRYRLKYCLKGPLNPKQPNLGQSSAWLSPSLSRLFILTIAEIHDYCMARLGHEHMAVDSKSCAGPGKRIGQTYYSA